MWQLDKVMFSFNFLNGYVGITANYKGQIAQLINHRACNSELFEFSSNHKKKGVFLLSLNLNKTLKTFTKKKYVSIMIFAWKGSLFAMLCSHICMW